MTILIITGLSLWSMGEGKGGEAFTRTVKKYAETGDQVYLISDVPVNKDSPLIDKDKNYTTEISAFKKYGQIRKLGLLFRFLDHLVATKRFKKTVGRIIEDVGKDNLVLYAYEVFGVRACKRISERYGVPLVTRFQGTILVDFPNNIVNQILRYPHYQALKTAADLVIMTNDGTRGGEILDAVGNMSRRLFLMNGLELMDSNIFSGAHTFEKDGFRQTLGIATDEIMFLTVSRLVGWKKVDRAIRGFSEFLKMGGNGKLVIVGDGDEKEALIQLCAETGAESHVLFVGAVKHAEVYRYMIAAEVFLSFFDMSNVGNPLLEAMTLGKCIVTLDVGDTRKLIHNRENGVLLTMDTLPTLGTVMQELADNAALRRELGEAAARYAQDNFYTWEKRMDIEYENVIALLNR